MTQVVPTEPGAAGAPASAGVTVGRVELVARDLDLLVGFYTSAVGLWVLDRADGVVTLGAGSDGFLVLRSDPGAAEPAPNSSGLFHTAFLLPGRVELSHSLRRLLELGVPMTGFSDHLVSEAIYLDDPEGNGIEIYRDRPRSEWPLDEAGHVLMATDPMDLAGVLGETAEGEPAGEQVPEGTRIGHVHLCVRDVAEAEAFYRDVIGLDLMVRYGAQASFLATGGYHHALGLNSWHSRGGPLAEVGARGLAGFELVRSDGGGGGGAADFDARDPSGNVLSIVSATA